MDGHGHSHGGEREDHSHSHSHAHSHGGSDDDHGHSHSHGDEKCSHSQPQSPTKSLSPKGMDTYQVESEASDRWCTAAWNGKIAELKTAIGRVVTGFVLLDS